MNLFVFYCKTPEKSRLKSKFFCAPENDTKGNLSHRILYAKGGLCVTVYADILFIVKSVHRCDAACRRAASLRLPIKTWRLLLAAALGGLFGLSALAAHRRLPASAARSRAGACGSRRRPSRRSRRQRSSKPPFCFCSSARRSQGFLSLLPFHGILLANGAVYFDISALLLIALTCAPTACCNLSTGFFQKREPDVLFFNRHGLLLWKRGVAFRKG